MCLVGLSSPKKKDRLAWALIAGVARVELVLHSLKQSWLHGMSRGSMAPPGHANVQSTSFRGHAIHGQAHGAVPGRPSLCISRVVPLGGAWCIHYVDDVKNLGRRKTYPCSAIQCSQGGGLLNVETGNLETCRFTGIQRAKSDPLPSGCRFVESNLQPYHILSLSLIHI